VKKTPKEELEEALIASVEFASREGGAPDSMFIPEYGWILINGELTEEGILWYKENYE